MTVNPKCRSMFLTNHGMFARGVKNDYRKDPVVALRDALLWRHPPEILEAGTPWPREFSSLSTKEPKWRGNYYPLWRLTTPGTLELKELSLAIKSPQE